jgi:hypothetical protein
VDFLFYSAGFLMRLRDIDRDVEWAPTSSRHCRLTRGNRKRHATCADAKFHSEFSVTGNNCQTLARFLDRADALDPPVAQQEGA